MSSHVSRNFNRNRTGTMLAVAVLGLSAFSSMASADQTKANNADALNLSTSWVGGVVPSAGDIAIWNNTVTAANTTVLGADLAWGGIRVINPGGAVTINGANTLTLGTGGIDMSAATQNLTIASTIVSLSGDQTWNIASGRTLTVNSSISGAGTLTKIGLGQLTVSRASTYGNTTVIGGTLLLNFNNVGGPATNLLSSTSTMTLQGAALNINTLTGIANIQNFDSMVLLPGQSTFGGTRSSNAKQIFQLNNTTTPFVRSAGATLDIYTVDTARTYVSLSPSYTQLGTIVDAGGAAYMTTAGLTSWAAWTNPGGTFNNITNATYSASDATTLIGNADITAGVTTTTLAADTTISTLRHNQNQSTTIDLGGFALTTGGILQTNTTSSTLTTISNGTLKGGAGTDLVILQNSAAAGLTISATVADNGAATGLTKGAQGLVTLSGANTYTGETFINAGVLAVSGNTNLGGVATGAKVNLNGGTLRATASFDMNNGGAGTNDRAITLGVNSGTLDVSAGARLGVTGVVSGIGNLTKSGTGTLALAGANTYGGSTTINAGTLLAMNASGSATSAGNVTVANTGILGGTGSIAGLVAVSSGGHLAPGDGVGTLALNRLTLNTGSILDFEIGSGVNDLLNITATNGLTINATGINLYQPGTTNPYATAGTYNLFQYTGTIAGAQSFNVLNPQPGASYSVATNGSFLTLTIVTGTAGTWNVPTGGSWNTSGNWLGGVPQVQNDAATFGAAISSPQTVTLDGSKTISTLIFNNASAAYTIAPGSGGSLTLVSGTTALITDTNGSHTVSAPMNLGSNTILTVTNAVDTLTVGDLSGSSTLTTAGLGTLRLLGNNSNAVIIGSNAVVQVGDGTTVGSLGNGFIGLPSTGILRFNHSDVVTLTNTISGSGSLVQAGSGTLVLAGNNTNSSTTILSGVIQVNAPTAIGVGRIAVTAGKLDLHGNSITTSGLSGAGVVETTTGNATLTMSSSAASTFSGVLQNSATGTLGLSVVSSSAAATAGLLTLTGSNTYTGDTTIVANGTQGASLAITSTSTLNPLSRIVVNVTGNVVPLQISDGVVLANPILMNVTQPSGVTNFMTVNTGNATFSGNLTTLTGLGNTPNDIPQSGVRFTTGTAATLTLTGNINSGSTTNVAAGTSNLFSTILTFTNGNFLLNNATINSGTSQFILGRANTSAANFTLNGNASISSNVGAGIEGGNMGGNGQTTTVNVVVNDASKISVNTANFSLSGASSTPTSLTLNGTSSFTAGGFTRSGTGAATVTVNGGSIIAGASNANFFPALANTTLVAGTGTGLNLNVGNFAVGIAQSISGAGNVNVLGGGTVTLTGTGNSYAGTTNVATGSLVFAPSGGNPTTFNIGAITGAGKIAVNANAALTSDAVTASSLQIDGTHTLRSNGTNVTTSVVGTLAIAGVTGAWTGKMEINNHVVIVNTANGTASKADVITALNDQVKQGATGTANGITSATVLADTTHKATYVVDNALLGLTTTIEGVAVNSSSVIVEATYQGDSNLDRKVNVTDLGVLATFYGQNVTGFGIVRGDFNGDGLVNVSDLGILATDYGLGTAPGSTFSLQADLAQFPTLAAAAAAVPEPASLAVLAVGAGALLTRRKRR